MYGVMYSGIFAKVQILRLNSQNVLLTSLFLMIIQHDYLPKETCYTCLHAATPIFILLILIRSSISFPVALIEVNLIPCFFSHCVLKAKKSLLSQTLNMPGELGIASFDSHARIRTRHSALCFWSGIIKFAFYICESQYVIM